MHESEAHVTPHQPNNPTGAPSHEPTLYDLGWSKHPTSLDDDRDSIGARPARVVGQGRGAWQVHDGHAQRVARPRSRSLSPTPVTGDWVSVSDDGQGALYVDAVLPRRTAVARVVAGTGSEAQVIAANIDVVAVCSPADAVNPRRLERELTAVWESGAAPLVVLTKADLVEDADAVLAEVSEVAMGVEVIAVTATVPGGVEPLAERLEPGSTLALIGPSGVGKSTLVNALAGFTVMGTAEIRRDGRGRHTTTGRHLIPLPGGGLVLDTPGMREFAPWADDEALASTFSDIETLAEGCRFTDCRHEAEPGCAVLAAAEADDGVAGRLRSWRALQRELAWRARRNDARLMAEERRKWVAISKEARRRARH